MHTRRTTPHPATSFLLLTLAALAVAWAGCSAGSSVHSSGTGMGGTAGSPTGTGGQGGDAGSDADTDADAGPTCSGTQKVCNGVCVDDDDPQYGCSTMYCQPCGSFGNAGTTCVSNACALGACNMGYADCNKMPADGCETSTDTDPNNCGGCGTTCNLPNATAKCTGGKCAIDTCKTGRTDCDKDPTNGCEADLQNDPQNCGVCGTTCTSPETCQGGKCGLYCPKGKADCNMMETDGCETPLGTNTDCNFCGDSCNLANSMSQCTQMGNMWVCNLGQCNPGFMNCDMIANTGCETNVQNDPNNCNSCGNQCPFGPNSSPICSNGTCQIVCDNGYADCDHNPANGCEVHIDADPTNCGGCSVQDPKYICSTNHATEVCIGGMCSINTCVGAGYTDCDLSAKNGCEVNVNTDNGNCGTCNKQCPAGTSCSSGNCVCPGTQTYCPGVGCVDTQTNVNNCGVCGKTCTTANGTPACTAGVCGVGSCNSGYAHCPGQPGTNCETAIGTDTNNCGMCGNVCSTNHDTASCTGGQCILACSPLFGDCDNNVGTGCETSVTTVAHCGTCTNVCTTQNGTPSCNVSGTTASCGVAGCSAGYANCPANGDGNDCKTFVGGSDVNNCGSCGHKCTTANGTPVCNGGVCGVGSCNAGYAHCPGQPGTDCETHIAGNDASNCGACGNVCLTACGGAAGHVSSAICTSGTCSIPAGGCASGYDDFDKQCADGCECKDSSNSTSCGSPHVLVMNVAAVSNIYPANPNAAYFSVTFSGNTLTSWHPKITLSDPLNEFVMDITTDPGGCSVALASCADHSATGITTWETSYGGPNPAGDPNSKTAGGVSNFQPIPLPGVSGTVYIKVYRKVAMTSCNNQFTLLATQ